MSHLEIEKNTFQRLERLISFSDAIFSVAITLSVIEVMPPNLSERILDIGAKQVLVDLMPKIVGVVATFALIGLYWISHHRLLDLLQKNTAKLTRLNLLFLMSIAIMPFAIKFSVAHTHDEVAVYFYASYMALAGSLQFLIWRHAVQNKLIKEQLSASAIHWMSLRTAITPVVFILSLGLVPFNPDWSRYSWILLLFSQRIVTAITKSRS